MLIAHFARVLNHSASNKMSTQALALCLNPVIFPEETSISAFAQGTKVSLVSFSQPVQVMADVKTRFLLDMIVTGSLPRVPYRAPSGALQWLADLGSYQ